MSHRITKCLFTVVLASVLSLPSIVFADKPVVDIYLLYSETCPHCHVVRTEILPPIQEKFGDQLNVIPLNLSIPEDFKTGLVLEAIYRVPPEKAGVPEIFVGNSVLIGSNSIGDYLEEEVQKLLDAGGFLMPTEEQLLEMIVWEEPAAETNATVTETVPFTETLNSPVFTPADIEATAAASAPIVTDTITATNEPPSAGPTDDSTVVATARPTTVTDAVATDETENTAKATATAVVTPAASPVSTVAASTSPVVPVTNTPATSATVTTALASNVNSARPIHMAYFYEVGCTECDRAKYVLNYLQQTDYPNLAIIEFDVVKQAALAKWLGEKYGLPESELLVTPVVFVGTDYLLESAITVQNLTPILDKLKETGAEATWEQFEASKSGDAVAGLFRNISVAAVVGAGLVDGVNPCAFATIVFFVAYLAFVGRKGRELVFSGIAFTLGVFLAYLLLGLGLLQVLEAIDITRWGRYFYIVVAVLCLVLAAINLTDYFKARRGKVEQMQLKLPAAMRRQINRVIREGSGVQAFVLVSFATGFVVSLIELACTGQVYVVILSALSHPTLRGQAFGYLLIYNVAFVVPLIAVFLLAFFGVSSGDLARVVERHTATVKLLTALLFLGLGVWLISGFLPHFTG